MSDLNKMIAFARNPDNKTVMRWIYFGIVKVIVIAALIVWVVRSI